jgi:hypothetical protein
MADGLHTLGRRFRPAIRGDTVPITDRQARIRRPGSVQFPARFPMKRAVVPPYTPLMPALDASLPLPTPVGMEGAAVRDAQTIADRIAADEAAADEARQAYQTGGLPAIEPDAAAAALLQSSEILHAVRASALLEEAAPVAEAGVPRGGMLYLTSERLIHAGAESTELLLTEIDEMAVALERLVLIRRRDGSDFALEVDQPRLLRVQLAAAIGAHRARRTAQP